MSIRPIFVAMAWVSASLTADSASESWPQFRGPTGQGHAGTPPLPLHWSESENVVWKTPVHGKAWSSPVIMDGRIWMSTASEDGTKLDGVCVDAASGKILHDLRLFEVSDPQFAHRFNSYGSPTPFVESDRVYITFGSPGTACLNSRTGEVVWKREDIECNHFRGAGSSPVVHGDLLIMNYDGSDHQFVLALDKRTGKTVWKTDRSIDFQDLDANGNPEADGDWRKAYSTPLIASFHGGESVLLSLGSKAFYAYVPESGRELWRIENRGQHSGTVRPVVGDDLIYFGTGFSRGELWAAKPGGSGVVTDTHVVWRVKRNAPNKPSPILSGDLLFMIDDGGIATCLEAASGDIVWKERVGGNYSASPILAADRIYFCSEEGKTTVVKAGREFEKLAENQLDDGFMASPAAVNGSLYLRSRTNLYRIGESKRPTGGGN